jgi:superfamily II RNA helicase
MGTQPASALLSGFGGLGRCFPKTQFHALRNVGMCADYGYPMSDPSPTLPPILKHLPPAPDESALLDGFTNWTIEQGIEMYPAQEEAAFELIAGSNVILNTPTGSGKSLVAVAAHFVGLGRDQRSVYTAPIKALVSEKFFELCKQFGSERVGMITGDGSINPNAPIICCTAEILANWALRDGHRTDVDIVIADEFHFYADPQRGWAWQLPILELPHCQFLLMSATLGNTRFFEDELTKRTGRETALVKSSQRPVPLDFEYRTTLLHTSIESLLESGRAPIYLVHFTQRDATEAAQSYVSLDPLTKEEKQRVKELIGGFRFDSPFGKGLRRFLVAGIGVHHAGLLPKYRLLVERLAQAGLLKIICGTDTLGVGVNVPIRSVLFTKLCKYDGSTTRILRNREFAQIAGRAGRRGFDDEGTVWAQAPEHVVMNQAKLQKAAEDAKKKKKMVKKKAPDRGYAHWDEGTFQKMVGGEPEPLTSSFQVNHQMIMSLLDRRGDGCAAVRKLMVDNHEPRKRQRQHIKQSISIYRSLVDAGLLEFPDEPDELGRRVRVDFDLQDEFALHQPLSLWALDAIEHLDRQFEVEERSHEQRHERREREREADVEDDASASDNPFAALSGLVLDEAPEAVSPEPDEPTNDSSLDNGGDDAMSLEPDESAEPADDSSMRVVEAETKGDMQRALAVMTIIEAVQESPAVVINAQIRKAKDEAMAEMKSSGVEYEERMERLAKVEPPRPMKDWVYADFNEFRARHPWVGGNTVKPKSIARDMFERSMTFGEYTGHYGLKQSEGVLLRYLSDVYKGITQNVPADAMNDELDEIAHWLGTLVRQVDSSLLDEWERLQNPDDHEAADGAIRPPTGERTESGEVTITSDRRAFNTMVRNAAFRWIEQLARRQRPAGSIEGLNPRELLESYWDEYDAIETDGDARHSSRFQLDWASGAVSQTIHDPEGHDEWRVLGEVDLAASREEDRLVIALVGIERR